MNSRILPQLAALLFVSLIPLRAQSSSVSQADRMEAASLAPLPANGVVPVKTIAGDFASNEQGAVGKYSGRRITVVGRIASLVQPSGENKVLTVVLANRAGNLPSLKAEFLAGSIPVNSELLFAQDGSQATILHRDRTGNILSQEVYLSAGQKVAIKGEFKNIKAGDIVLTDCKLTRKP